MLEIDSLTSATSCVSGKLCKTLLDAAKFSCIGLMTKKNAVKTGALLSIPMRRAEVHLRNTSYIAQIHRRCVRHIHRQDVTQ